MPIWPSTPRSTPIERLLRLLPQVDSSPEGLMYLVPELLDLLREVLPRRSLSLARRTRGCRRVDRDCRASHLVLGTSFAIGDVVYVAVH